MDEIDKDEGEVQESISTSHPGNPVHPVHPASNVIACNRILIAVAFIFSSSSAAAEDAKIAELRVAADVRLPLRI